MPANHLLPRSDSSGAAVPLRIAAVQGASNKIIQTLLLGCVQRWRQAGARVVGVVEAFDPREKRAWEAVRLLNLATGDTYPVFQDLGPYSTACHLDPAGIVSACEAVRQDIMLGCDLVVLSKFGQLEAMRSGLMDAFVIAVETETAILTAVSPSYHDKWSALAAPLGVYLPPDETALDLWWARCSPRITTAATSTSVEKRLTGEQ